MIEQIRARLPELAPRERKVGEALVADPKRVLAEPIAALAARAGTSEPTVVRFCRSIGLSGYRELKLELARALERDAQSLIHADIEGDESAQALVEKVTARAVRELTRLREQLSPEAVETAAAHVTRARHIEFWGMGVSGFVAADAQNRFFRLGLECVAYNDAPTLRQTGAIRGPTDLIVAISHSGRSSALLAACEAATRGGATLIALTSPGTPLAELADVVLDVTVEEDPGRYTPRTSRLAHLLAIDILQVCVAARMGKRALESLRATKAALSPEGGTA